MFGIASSLAIFQSTMDDLLQDTPHVAVYLDDILVTDRAEENLKNLGKVGKYQAAFEAQSLRFPRFWSGKDVVLSCDTWPYGVEGWRMDLNSWLGMCNIFSQKQKKWWFLL